MNSLRHNATHPPHSASAHQHNQQLTTKSQQQPQQQPPTSPQQQPSTIDNKCAVTTRTTRSATVASVTTAAIGNTKQQQQQLFHQAVSQNALFLASRPTACAQKVKASSNTSCNSKYRHMALNSMVYPSQRQVTQGPQSPPSDTEQPAQKPQLSITAIISASCLKLCGFLHFLSV